MSEEDKPESNVVSLAAHSNNSKHWTPRQMFDEKLTRGQKAVSVILDTTKGSYAVQSYLSQVGLQEAVVLLEVAKTQLVEQLRKAK